MVISSAIILFVVFGLCAIITYVDYWLKEQSKKNKAKKNKRLDDGARVMGQYWKCRGLE